MKVVVRFAPSPTGPLHIGSARTTLYNYLLVKKYGGKLILRIEDTDRTRFVEGAEDHINESFKWLGITFDEGVGPGGPHGPYRQSERAAQGLYRKYAEQLIASGNAYYAFDTPEELEAMRERLKASGSSVQQYNHVTRGEMTNSLTLSEAEVQQKIEAGEPYVVRMKMPNDQTIGFEDVVRGSVSFQSDQLDDKVLLKSDGMPTYHLAVVVDDYHMEITHIIRGEEWLSSTPLHVKLYEALGWGDKIPKFVHLPLILNPNGKGKMSKRQGDKLGFSVFPIQWQDPQSGKITLGYREKGYLPEAMINFLALLGWNPGNDEEIMNLDRLTELFTLDRINQSGTKFDLDKLNWFNQTYIREVLSTEELLKRVKPYIVEAGHDMPDDTYLTGVIDLMKTRVTFLSEMVSEGSYFFHAPDTYDEKMAKKRWKEDSPELIQALMNKFDQLPVWNSEGLHHAFEQLVQEREIGNGRVLAPLRLALTGVPSGPGAFDIAELIGKPETMVRLQSAIEKL